MANVMEKQIKGMIPQLHCTSVGFWIPDTLTDWGLIAAGQMVMEWPITELKAVYMV